MKLGVLVEGQEGLRWKQWMDIVAWTEELGYESLWLSDHLMPLDGGEPAEPIDPFLALGYAASRTNRIRLGTLVSPVTFRHPAIVARLASGLAHLSDGRFTLGLGAGWFEPEHRTFRIPLPPPRERLAMLDNAASTVRALLDARSTAARMPATHPVPVLIGGAGERQTLRMVAEHADEWNVPGISVAFYRRKVAALLEHCAAVGRDPAEVGRSIAFTHVTAASRDAARSQAARMAASTPDQYLPGKHAASPHWLVGAPPDIVRQIQAYAAEGVERIMLQWRTPPTREQLELLAREVSPYV